MIQKDLSRLIGDFYMEEKVPKLIFRPENEFWTVLATMDLCQLDVDVTTKNHVFECLKMRL